jgi:hypothetical protein
MLASLSRLGVACASVPTTRGGLAATSFRVTASDEQPHRGLADVLAIVGQADLPPSVRHRATRIFERLAVVEATVHGVDPSEIHFHEVGAVDSIVDVLGVCLGFDALELDGITVSPIALGGGTANTSHGILPVPTPAALGLLAGSLLVGHGGPVDVELATPTGIAVLAEWATATGPLPAMSVAAIGIGAGGRELEDRANIVRLVIGTPAVAADASSEAGWLTIEANVDDLDPRLWPGVLDRLLAAGAADAWLTPILMKKGRPAHTVSALVGPDHVDAIRDVLVTETSTIGVRTTPVGKHGLERSWITVDVAGEKVRVKLAHDGARRTNLAPEFDDVVAAAATLGIPAKDVLARATAAALQSLER